jgi:hypothetical protein
MKNAIQVECGLEIQHGYSCLWTPAYISLINTEIKMPLDIILTNLHFHEKRNLFHILCCHNGFDFNSIFHENYALAEILSMVKIQYLIFYTKFFFS